MAKLALKWMRTEIANNRVSPAYDENNQLKGFYFNRLRKVLFKKWINDDAWEYASLHFNIDQ
jgi:hypothetical protein